MPGMALNYLTDLARVGQYLRIPVYAEMAWRTVREDALIVDQLRRGLLPLPTDGAAQNPADVFPPLRRAASRLWPGDRVAVVATGGSGALASIVGVVRALGEAGVSPSGYGLCSGSTLFGMPMAAGLSSDQVCEAMLGLRPAEYLDPDWQRLARAPLTLGRGWAGLLRGEAVEEFVRG